jgi:hypothetical protein
MAKVKLEFLKFEKILTDYARIREITIPDAVVANARLLCVELARRTQPFGANDVAKTAGVERTSRDIKKIIKSDDTLTAMSERVSEKRIRERLQALITAGRYDVVQRVFERIGYLRKWSGMQVVSGSTIKLLHQEARNPTTGRTKSRGTQLNIASKADLSTYIEGVVKRVGISKAGWAECARQLRSVTKGSPTRGIPGWASKQTGHGTVQDQTNDPKNPTVILINHTPWVDRILPESQQLQAKDIVANKMKNQMMRILKERKTTITE